jgi:hypothetical protein
MLPRLYYLMAIIDTGNLPNNGNSDPTTNVITIVLNIVLAFTASISVLMIVIAGFRYVTAHGEPSAMAQARKTIIYSIIGLLVTMTAFAIVTFVVGGIS